MVYVGRCIIPNGMRLNLTAYPAIAGVALMAGRSARRDACQSKNPCIIPMGYYGEWRVNNERVNNGRIGLKALRCIACGRATEGSAAVGRGPPHGRMTSRDTPIAALRRPDRWAYTQGGAPYGRSALGYTPLGFQPIFLPERVQSEQ